MSTLTPLQQTLARLADKKKQTTSTYTGKRTKFWKPKDKSKSPDAKNNIIFLKWPNGIDPFAFYNQHGNLMEKGRVVPCKKFNLGEECIICELIDTLKAENWKGNMAIWKPLEHKERVFSPIIDLDNIDEGVQYWNYSTSVKNQLINWLENLEEDETEFYNQEALQKIIVNYDSEADAINMFKLDKKTLKGISSEQIEKWQSEVAENLHEITKGFYKNDEEINILINDYLKKTEEKLKELEGVAESVTETQPVKVTKPTHTVNLTDDEDEKPVVKTKKQTVVEDDDEEDEKPTKAEVKKVVVETKKETKKEEAVKKLSLLGDEDDE